MSDERVHYDDGEVRVTGARAVLGGTTYAIANVTSVRSSATPGGSMVMVVAGALLMVLGLGAVGVALAGGPSGGIVTGGVVVVVGLALVVGNATKRPAYTVHVGTAGGELAAFTSPDEGRVRQIVQAMNDAVIDRG